MYVMHVYPMSRQLNYPKDMEIIPYDFEEKVADYCNKIYTLRTSITSQSEKLTKISRKIQTMINKIEYRYCNVCLGDDDLDWGNEVCTCNPTDGFFNIGKVKEFNEKLGIFVEKFESIAETVKNIKSSLREMTEEYFNYMEQLGIDMDNRLYDEDFYSFIHEFENEN